MYGELFALLIVALLLAGAAYSGMAARAKPRDEGRRKAISTSANAGRSGSKIPI
jgi:hypothetical protein